MDIEYKTWPIGSRGVWKRGGRRDLVLDIPHFRLPRSGGTLPPLAALNAVLSEGVSDAGMSGCCEWTPLQIAEDEYSELVPDLLTEPGTKFRPPGQ